LIRNLLIAAVLSSGFAVTGTGEVLPPPPVISEAAAPLSTTSDDCRLRADGWA
jgi:hypothetical protein